MSKALIFAFKCIWEWDITNKFFFNQLFQTHFRLAFGCTAGVDGGGGKFVKLLAAACTKIEDA